MCEEERAGAGVVKLASIVALNCLDGGAELCPNIGEKVGQCGERVGFQLQRKSP